MCPPGQVLDPREMCSCIPIAEKEALNRCGDWKAKDEAKKDSEKELLYECDDDGYRVCPAKHSSCPPGSFYDDSTCECFSEIKCMMMCPPGQALDPRKGCSCISIEDKKALTRCGDWKAKDAKKEAEKIYLESIVGKYIVDGYENNKNDWHYVKIMPINAENGEYLWENSAGVRWPLKQRPDMPKKMKVGTACPYYKKGYTEALLKFNDDGKVVAI